MTTHRIAAILLSFISIFSTFAQTRIPPERPTLIIGIVIDQMRYEYLNRFWEKFEADGFKRLVNEGTLCKNAHYDYLFTQTAPGYATIATGTTPANHGIISNLWYERLTEKMIYSTFDEDVKPVGTDLEVGKHSVKNLKVSNLADEIALSNFKFSKIVAVSLNAYASVISAGHFAHSAYWFDCVKGYWVSNSLFCDSLPTWVREFNAKKIPELYMQRQWATLLPIEKYVESMSDNLTFEKGFDKKMKTFPYELKNIAKKLEKPYEAMKYTPYGNNLTKDFAVSAIVNEELGKDQYTDFITISFAANQGISEKFGATSVEIEDAFLRLDSDLAHFLKFIDEFVGKQNVLIFLTSDQGAMLDHDFMSAINIPTGKFRQKQTIALLKTYLKALYGHGDWVQAYNEQQIYLNHNLIEDSKISLIEIQNKVAQFIIQFAGVANAITATTLQTTYFSGGVFEKMQNSYNQKRSGDVLINLEPGWISEDGSGHNSAYSYDTHVPLVWYGWKIKRGTIFRQISIRDIAPTISTFLNISNPNAANGNFIIELAR